ncbi:MAG: phosphomannomutase/phosphoglucomutase [Acidimicrobiales bacterium]
MNTTIFKAYDVRGLVPDELDSESARAIGAGFSRFVGGETIVVGRDMRSSSLELSEAFIEGANAVGVSAIRIGLCSTDLLYFASGKLNLPAVMFTASHNPAQYNGIKMCRASAGPISMDTGLAEIEALAEEFQRSPANRGVAPVRNTDRDMLGEYVDHVRSFVDLSVMRPLRIVADTANGMGGLVVPAVFEALGFDLDLMYGDLDGTFPNHPADPIQPENLVDLKARVLSRGADIGLAFDGDADRVFLVDDEAAPVSGSTTTALVASEMLRRYPGATILYNLICSKAVPEIISELGGVPIRTRVGHSFIKATMAESGAIFGGEHSGHYYFRDNYRADSGLIASMFVLSVLSGTSDRLSQVRVPFERYAASGEVNTKVKDVASVLDFIQNAYGDRANIDQLDGLTVDFGDWWFNVRPSNTEPLLRLNLEAKSSSEVAVRVHEVLAVISKADEKTMQGEE